MQAAPHAAHFGRMDIARLCRYIKRPSSGQVVAAALVAVVTLAALVEIVRWLGTAP